MYSYAVCNAFPRHVLRLIFFLTVTFVSLLAIFLPVTHLLAPLLNLLATILLLPLPVFRIFSSPAAIAIPVRQTNLNSLEKALSVQDSDADFGAHNHAQSRGLSIILSLAQFSAFIASIFAILVVREDDTPHTQGSIARSVAFKILGAIFMFLSLVGITTSFYRKFQLSFPSLVSHAENIPKCAHPFPPLNPNVPTQDQVPLSHTTHPYLPLPPAISSTSATHLHRHHPLLPLRLPTVTRV